MRNFSFVILAIALVTITACQKEDSVIPVADNSKSVLITDQAVLGSMISYVNQPITLTGGTKSTETGINLVAQAVSPEANGVKLSATSVLLRDTRAYVTYHERGEGFGGAVYVFNISNPSLPVPSYLITFEEYDINACDINVQGTKLYLAGGSNKKGAALLIVDLNSSGIPVSSDFQVLEFSNAASANGVIQGGNYLYISAGHTGGGLFAYNKNTLKFEAEDLYDGATFSTANGRTPGKRHLGLEGGDNAKLHVYKIHGVDQSDEWIFNVGSVSHQNVEPEYEYFGKGVIFIKNNGNVCYMAMGKYGMKAVDIYTGALVYESPAGMITYGNTNGVSADNNYIYLANGAQGLYVYEPGIGTAMNFVGKWDGYATGPASANFVQSNNTNIFVAFGKEGGLSILSKP